MKKAKKDPEISLSSSHLIRHESSHGPADLMVLVGFSFRSKQNKQEPGQGKHSEREEHALAQRAPKEIPGSSQPRARLERGHVGSPTPVMNLTFIRTDRKSSFWANFPYSWPVGLKATAGKGETKARRCGCEKRACSHWPCSLGTPNRCMQFDVFLGLVFFFFSQNFVLLIRTWLGWELPSCPRGGQPGSGGQMPRWAGEGNPALLRARWTLQPLWEFSS